jgi:DEAD/DEAH box helicase domain-containing protein
VAYKIVRGCDCVDGCPKCVYSPYCGNNNKMLSRKNAMRILEIVLGGGGAPSVREVPKGVRGLV